jgi:hypothetical protein
MAKMFRRANTQFTKAGSTIGATFAKVPGSEIEYKMPLELIHLRYNGLFDYDAFYAAFVDWSKDNGYLWLESIFKHKVPSPAGAEQEILWELKKNVTEFVKYEIKINAHIWDMLEVHIDVGGKQKSLTNARIDIQIQPVVLLDWQKRFQGGGMQRFFSKMYWKIMSDEIENVYVDQLYYRMWNLQATMKKYFDMQTKAYPYEKYLGED